MGFSAYATGGFFTFVLAATGGHWGYDFEQAFYSSAQIQSVPLRTVSGVCVKVIWCKKVLVEMAFGVQVSGVRVFWCKSCCV